MVVLNPGGCGGMSVFRAQSSRGHAVDRGSVRLRIFGRGAQFLEVALGVAAVEAVDGVDDLVDRLAGELVAKDIDRVLLVSPSPMSFITWMPLTLG